MVSDSIVEKLVSRACSPPMRAKSCSISSVSWVRELTTRSAPSSALACWAMDSSKLRPSEPTATSGPPQYYDVTYEFRGVEHRVQMAAHPGRTITVNGNGEPRTS